MYVNVSMVPEEQKDIALESRLHIFIGYTTIDLWMIQSGPQKSEWQ